MWKCNTDTAQPSACSTVSSGTLRPCRMGLNWAKRTGPLYLDIDQLLDVAGSWGGGKCHYHQLRPVSRKELIYGPLAANSLGSCGRSVSGGLRWQPTRVISIHLLWYSDLLASYKIFIPSGNNISRILVGFSSWGTKGKKLNGMNYTAFCHWYSSQDAIHTHFLSYIAQFRFSPPSAVISAGLGWLFDKMTQIVISERLEPLVNLAFSGHVCCSCLFTDQIGQGVKRDAPMNHLDVQVFFPPPTVKQITYLILMIRVSCPDRMLTLPCLFVSLHEEPEIIWWHT